MINIIRYVLFLTLAEKVFLLTPLWGQCDGEGNINLKTSF